MAKIKLIIPLIAISMFFGGCFGEDDSSPTNTFEDNKIRYQHKNFTINIPQDWDIIEKSDFTSTVPEEIVVAFRNNIKNEIFTANVNISMIALSETLNSTNFAKSSKNKASTSLIEFEEKDLETKKIMKKNNFIEGAIMEISGKKTSYDPIINFTQVFIVDNKIGYTITAGYLAQEDETVVKYIEEMLDSFELK
jgi:PBP1b-binding outer membrane lipoprotein LpoB